MAKRASARPKPAAAPSAADDTWSKPSVSFRLTPARRAALELLLPPGGGRPSVTAALERALRLAAEARPASSAAACPIPTGPLLREPESVASGAVARSASDDRDEWMESELAELRHTARLALDRAEANAAALGRIQELLETLSATILAASEAADAFLGDGGEDAPPSLREWL